MFSTDGTKGRDAGLDVVNSDSNPDGGTIPSRPLTIIEPTKGRSTLEARDVWAYRELLYFLTWRDVKVRYKQTLLGAAWAILQPLLAMLIFTVFFGKLAGVPSDNVPYPVFVYAGLLPWTFFANAITNSGNSLVGSSNLITKVYFPRMIIPSAAVLAGLVDLGVASVLLVALMAFYGLSFHWSAILLFLYLALTAFLALAFGLWFSALNVKYRDVRHALPFLIQIGMFVTPVIYPISFLPDGWRWVQFVNPMAGIVEGFRASLFGLNMNWPATAVSAVVTALALYCAATYFRRVERSFADVV